MKIESIAILSAAWLLSAFLGCQSKTVDSEFKDSNTRVLVRYFNSDLKPGSDFPSTYVGKAVNFDVCFENQSGSTLSVTGLQFGCGCAWFETKEKLDFPIKVGPNRTLEFCGSIDTRSRDPGLHMFPAEIRYDLGNAPRSINLDLKVKCRKRVSASTALLCFEPSKDEGARSQTVTFEVHDPGVDLNRVTLQPVAKRILVRKIQTESPSSIPNSLVFELSLAGNVDESPIQSACELKFEDEVLFILPVQVDTNPEGFQFSPKEIFLSAGSSRKVLFRGLGLDSLSVKGHPEWLNVKLSELSPEFVTANVSVSENAEIGSSNFGEIVFHCGEKEISIPVSILK